MAVAQRLRRRRLGARLHTVCSWRTHYLITLFRLPRHSTDVCILALQSFQTRSSHGGDDGNDFSGMCNCVVLLKGINIIQ